MEAIVPVKLWRVEIGRRPKQLFRGKYFGLFRGRVELEAPLQGATVYPPATDRITVPTGILEKLIAPHFTTMEIRKTLS
jgi:hypothetical protein